MNKTYYFRDEEIIFITDKGGGTFLRSLVQREMPTSTKSVVGNDVGVSVCKKCGHILMEGKCINKECR